MKIAENEIILKEENAETILVIKEDPGVEITQEEGLKAISLLLTKKVLPIA